MNSNKMNLTQMNYGEKYEDVAIKIYELNNLKKKVNDCNLDYKSRCTLYHKIWVLEYSIKEFKNTTN